VSDPLRQRGQILSDLERGVDVLIIGGGITGAGVALDAVTRGYTVGLVERSDFAGGTSSRSTKLVHGGLRYLPQWQLGLVREAAIERDRLLRLAPHLVTPLPFVLPLYAGLRRPLGIEVPGFFQPLHPLLVRTGLWLYDLLAMTDLRHETMSPHVLHAEFPNLRTEGLTAAYRYYDAQTDDVRLTHAVLNAARRAGALTLNYAEARTIAPGSPSIITVRDRHGSSETRVRARHIVNAAGVWAEEVAHLSGDAPFHIQHSKGTHLVLDLPLAATSALVIPETDDGRLAFLVPWRDRWILGTTDESYDGNLSAPRPTAGEARYLLDHLNRYLRLPVGPEAIVGAYAGLRPLVRRGASRPAEVSRSHEVVEHPNAMVSIIGGKLTTYRKMAKDTVDALVRRDSRRTPCRTGDLQLDPDAAASPVEQAALEAGLTLKDASYLHASYGSAAVRIMGIHQEDPSHRARLVSDLPVLAAEVVYACREEQAVSLTDWLMNRSRLAILDRRRGQDCAPRVAALMAGELGWSEAEVAAQLQAFACAIAAEMSFTTSFARLPAARP
jgi:glycerol-3-phosphate dehydrogenase